MTDYESKRDEAAKTYVAHGYGCDGDTSADSFRKGADWARADLMAEMWGKAPIVIKSELDLSEVFPLKPGAISQVDDWELFKAEHVITHELQAKLDIAKAALEKISEMDCPYGEGGCDSDKKRNVAWSALSQLEGKLK